MSQKSPRCFFSRKRLLIGFITLLLLAVFVIGLQRWMLTSRIKRSVEDILVLRHAIEDRASDYGPCSMYPDFAFASVESRREYGINTEMPQEMVDNLGHTGPNDPPIYAQLEDTSWEHEVAFQIRLRRWEFFLWSYPQLVVSKFAVSHNITDHETHVRLRTMADKQGMNYRKYLQVLSRKMEIPHDPFALADTNRLYRYGRPPDNPLDYIGSYCMWVIAGNGPDRDEDIDVSKFNPVLTSEVSGAVCPDLGFGRNLVDNIYDPTNGTRSNGDIVLFSESPFFDRTLWDLNQFKDRYD